MTASVIPKGWDVVQTIGADWSPRKFFRVSNSGKTAILMDSSGPEIPGHRIYDFLRIDKWLGDSGLRVPAIIDHNEKAGWVLMEDFGDESFKIHLDKGGDKQKLYTTAKDVLKKIAATPCTLDLPMYETSYVHKGRRRIIDWYIPAVTGKKTPDGLRDEYLAIWHDIEKAYAPCARGFLHMDFHVENLMVLNEQGTNMCGLLDFQGGMIGPVPYDLANLLEDARRDVDKDTREMILKSYCAGMDAEVEENFRIWYRILATQFHCRVIGQAIKLSITNNNPRLMEFIPRLQYYIINGLRDPALKPLEKFFTKHKINFTRPLVMDLEKIKSLVAKDAF